MPILKQRETLRNATTWINFHNSVHGWMPPSLWNGGKTIGRGTYSLLDWVNMPRIKPFSLHWVQHRTFTGSSVTGTCVVVDERLRPFYRFEGDIAACMGGNLPQYTPYGFDDQLAQRAVIRAASKLLEPDVDYGLILAEAKEAMDLFTSPATFLLKQLKKLRRPRNFRRPKRGGPGKTLQYMADAWLQMRYAILPTVSDINSVVENTTKILTNSSEFRRKGSGVQGPVGYERSSGVECFNSCYFTVYREVGVRTKYVSHIFYYLVDYAAAERNRLGLGISQLSSLGWELIPFSFVFDWAINVGDWLKAVQPTPEYARLGQTCSLIVENYGSTSTGMCSLQADMSWSSPCVSSYAWSEKFYERQVDPPLPGLPPVNASILNLVRSIDAASLSMKPILNFLKTIKH